MLLSGDREDNIFGVSYLSGSRRLAELTRATIEIAHFVYFFVSY